MDAVYVVNPQAGRGRGAEMAQALPALLQRHDLRGDVVTTTGSRNAVDVAREAAQRVPLVVAVGGDGTAHEVVNGVAGTNATFGLLPYGTGNDLALALGIPTETSAALDVLKAAHTSRIDLGKFDDGWFANSLGLGFEAQVTIESLRVRRLKGFSVYLWAVMKALRGLKCPRLRIRTDEGTIEGRRLLVCIGNGPRVGGGFYLTPDAINDDGVLDVCIADGMGRLRVLTILPKALNGTHVRESRITMLRTRSITIESEDGFPFHADGEVIDTSRRKLRIEIHPRALNVITPRKAT